MYFDSQREVPPYEKPQDINVVNIIIDNHPNARPQSGINEAEVVFETAVAPGITRFLAIFDPNQNFSEVGPIRSARKNLVDIASGYSGAILHSGGSSESLNLLNYAPLMDFDEIYGSGDYFYRSSTSAAPHNLYTNKDLFLEGVADKNGKITPFDKGLPTGEMSGGSQAEQVTVCFKEQSYDTVFKWDSSKQEYQRYENGKPSILADDTPITANNVIVLSTPHEKNFDYFAGEYVIAAKVIGEGPANFYRDGQVWKGRWEKDSNNSEFKFTVDGQTMKFNSGTSWILLDELPAITGLDPQDNEVSVGVSSDLKIQLNAKLKTGPDFDLISLKDETNNLIATEQNLKGNLLTISPLDLLAYNCRYTVNIPATALVDDRGQTLGQDTIYTFRTQDEYDFNLTLGKGWNLVSIPRPIQSFELIETDVEAWVSYAIKDGNLSWITDADKIYAELNNPASAVYIKTLRPTTMRFSWSKEITPATTFTAKTLSQGWNLIGSSARTDLKNNLASLRFANGQGLTQIYNPNLFNRCKLIHEYQWEPALIDISDWHTYQTMNPYDGYWVFLRGVNQPYSIPISYDLPSGGGSPVPIPSPGGGGGSGEGSTPQPVVEVEIERSIDDAQNN
ncbi:MAG TPA: DUF3048 domain-containing protein [Syntrophomonadaceae bacterium]|nr:DUF3048 domain-containing protein [Syntrophomonadaceae bacterium]